MRVILVACLLCLSVAAFAGQPDAFSAGLAAYKAQDYSTALADFRLAAQQGDADAQYSLGVMYYYGQGVPPDYARALKWYRLAAQQGNADAQVRLGVMYGTGQGIPQDNVEAYKWVALAKGAAKPGSKASKAAGEGLTMLAPSMTPAQIAQAQQEASAWWAAHHKGG